MDLLHTAATHLVTEVLPEKSQRPFEVGGGDVVLVLLRRKRRRRGQHEVTKSKKARELQRFPGHGVVMHTAVQAPLSRT